LVDRVFLEVVDTSMTPSNSQAGAALVMALLISVMLFGIAGAYMTVSYGGFDNSTRELAIIQARLGAEDGIQLSLAELKSGVDADADGLGNLTVTEEGRTITATCTSLGGNLYRIHSVGVTGRARKGATVVAERIPTGALSFSPRAAITAQGSVTTLGGIVVDGRDWNITGTAVVGPGKYGVSSTSTIVSGGSSKIGGNGIAPSALSLLGTREMLASWSDGINQDGDGSTDEENFDGIDNDGDGEIDEDTHGYPKDPDVELGLVPGTLKAAAQSMGTYFTTQAQVDACITANGGKMPGGKIIYVDFSPWQPATLSSSSGPGSGSWNTTPSVIVHHNAAGNALMKNVHGSFLGLVLCDGVTHLNGDFTLLGALMSFAPASYGNAFGNGNANVKLCTAALTNLPTLGTAANVRIKAWERAVAQ
jgi:hypothetical protein